MIQAVQHCMIPAPDHLVFRMNSSPAQQLRDETTAGVFNYLDATVQPSLYRNGEVLTRRDPDGSDGGSQGVNLEDREMIVHNGRNLHGAERRTVRANGFELITEPLQKPSLDFFDHQQVVREYYAHCADIVSQVTGATAFAFDHNIRSASGKETQRRIQGGQQVQGPAHVVHGDYTLYSAPQRLRDLAKPPGGNDTLKSVLSEGQSLIDANMVERSLADGGRFSIINVWRNIAKEPVATHPLALCDGQSVDPNDLVVFEIHYQDRIGENYFAKHAPGHQWYFFPEMTGDEAILIKQWDSAGPLARSDGAEADSSDRQAPCTFSFHTAFEDPATPANAPDRWSIETRCIVIYD